MTNCLKFNLSFLVSRIIKYSILLFDIHLMISYGTPEFSLHIKKCLFTLYLYLKIYYTSTYILYRNLTLQILVLTWDVFDDFNNILCEVRLKARADFLPVRAICAYRIIRKGKCNRALRTCFWGRHQYLQLYIAKNVQIKNYLPWLRGRNSG